MTDLICRKSMTRCITPGTCSPHGGCRDTESVSSAWLVQLRSEFVAVGRQCNQLKADLARVEPCFDDVQALVGALGWLGYSTPEGGEACAARWLELVRTLIRVAGQSKMLRMDTEKLAEFDKLKAENAGLKTGYEAYEQVNAELKAENVALVDAMNQIVRVTKLGDEAFGIACLVIGELSAYANMAKEAGEPDLKTPDETDQRTAEYEAAAKAIYEQWSRLPGYVPWVNGGNSLKQDEARRLAAATQAC